MAEFTDIALPQDKKLIERFVDFVSPGLRVDEPTFTQMGSS
jgi:hypothetical protein